MKEPRITRIEVHVFEYEVEGLGTFVNDPNPIYEPGGRLKRRSYALRIGTDAGVTGEYVRGGPVEMGQLQMFAPYLIGKDPLEREKIYNDLKFSLRKYDRMGVGWVDIALWDIAGKLHEAPIYQLLGGYRKKLPCYASTYCGDHQPDGLNSPEAFADFAQQCLEIGYPAFKAHVWEDVPIEQHVAMVHAIGGRVGGRMDLMLDPACLYKTFADALKVGKACDEENFFWIEDPLPDGGFSQFAHRKLRQMTKTPILQMEHVRGFEPKVDFIVVEATDYVRADPDYDGGITGAMKIAHAAEGFGLDVEIHAPGPAHRHCMASIRNTNYYEMGLVHPKLTGSGSPIYKSDYLDGLDAVDGNGCVLVPEGPGLGVEYDWDFIMGHRIDGVEYK